MNSHSLTLSSNLSLSTFYNTINNLENITNINMDQIIKFTKRELTERTADNYLNIISELCEKVESINTSIEEKNQFKSLFIFLFSKMCESDCKGLILNNISEKNKKYKLMLEEMNLIKCLKS